METPITTTDEVVLDTTPEVVENLAPVEIVERVEPTDDVDSINSNEISIIETHENPDGEVVELVEETDFSEPLAEVTESDILG